MKNTILRLTLALVLTLVGAGIAAATVDAVETDQTAPAPAVEAPTAEAPEQAEAIFLPEVTEAGACCFVDCYEEFMACTDTCGTNQSCFQGCFSDLQSCKSSC